jgi:hypothetical protein
MDGRKKHVEKNKIGYGRYEIGLACHLEENVEVIRSAVCIQA